jgi:hypothetical protein
VEPILGIVTVVITAVIVVMGIRLLTDDLPLPPPSSGRLA